MSTETAQKTTWQVDPTHSEVQFKVRHLVISTVTGTFNDFSGSFTSHGEDFDGADAEFNVQVGSVDTNMTDRDQHLRSGDFFDAEQYPEMKFKGKFHKTSDSQYKLVGDLSVKEITKEVELTAELGGIADDPYGNTKAGFEISGSINRRDFGLTWSQMTETGTIVVGDQVKLQFNIQAAKS